MEQNNLPKCSFCNIISQTNIALNSRPDLKKKYSVFEREPLLTEILDLIICVSCIKYIEVSYDDAENSGSLQVRLARRKLHKSKRQALYPQQSKTDEEIITIHDSDSDDELDLIRRPNPELRNSQIKTNKNRESSVELVDVVPSLYKGNIAQTNVESATLPSNEDVSPIKKETLKEKLDRLKKSGRVKFKSKDRVASISTLKLKYLCQSCNFSTNAIAQILEHLTNYQCTSLHCNQCNVALKGLNDLLEHSLYHGRGELYMCYFCKFETTNQRLYVTHMRHNCGEIYCNYC